MGLEYSDAYAVSCFNVICVVPGKQYLPAKIMYGAP